MSSKSSRGSRPGTTTSRITLPSSQPAASPPAVRVVRRDGGTIGLSVDLDALPAASQMFAASTAWAQERHGAPELVFVQTSVLEPERAERVVAVRYAREQFVRRPEELGAFIQGLEQYLDQAAPGWRVEAPRPKPHEKTTTITVEADLEVIIRTGGSSSFLPISCPAWDRHRVITGKRDDFPSQIVVEITMPVDATGRLLRSWTELVARLKEEQRDARLGT